PPSTLASGSARHQSSLTTPTTSTVRSPLQYFLFKAPAHPQIYTLSLHDALPIFNNSMGGTDFRNSSTAANATITNAGQTTMFSSISPGRTDFQDAASAGSATITNNGGTASSTLGGTVRFNFSSTAVSATITNNAS